MQCIIQNAPIDYIDEGQGPTLLFVHGWGDQKMTWRPLIDVLKLNYRCIALDLPNFGASARNAECTTLDDFAACIAMFVEKLELDDYSYVGHSMGGQIGIYAVGQRKLAPHALILVAAAGIRADKNMRRKVLKAGSTVVRKMLPLRLKQRIYRSIGSDYDPTLSIEHKAIINSVLSRDIQPEAARITIPTLLLYDSEDTSTPPRYGRLFSEIINGSQYVELSGYDHFVHQKAAPIVAVAMKKFLEERAA